MQCPCMVCIACWIGPECCCFTHAVEAPSQQVDAVFCDRGCSANAVVAVSHQVDSACSDGGCSAHEGACSVPSEVAGPPAVCMNLEAVLRQCMQCPTRWIQHVVTEDAVLRMLDAVILR